MSKSLLLVLFLLPSFYLYADFENIALIEDTDGSINSSIAMGNTYLSKASCAFFKKYPQNFNIIFYFTTYKTTLFGTPEGWAVKRNIKGIGFDMPTDQSNKYCSSNGRLRHTIKLADISQWPDNPDDAFTSAINGAYSGLEAIGHEVGHLWLVGAKYKDEGGNHCTLRALMPDTQPSGGDCDGYKDSDFGIHYSYYFDSRSVMFGSFIEQTRDNEFKFYNQKRGFSELDQYFMGIRDKSEVNDMLLVETGNISDSSTTPLKKGETKIVIGNPKIINIGQIIAALGQRDPPSDSCHLKGAFAIIYPNKQPPSAAVLQKVENYRKKWEEYYIWATSERGSFDTTLDGSGYGTNNCPAPVNDDAGYKDSTNEDIKEDISYKDGEITDTFQDSNAEDIFDIEKDETTIDINTSDLSDSYLEDNSYKEDDTLTDVGNLEDISIDVNIQPDSSINKSEDSGCSCSLME